jgi:hypothetical protein
MTYREREEGIRRANDGVGINSNASSAQRDAFNQRQHEIQMRQIQANAGGSNVPMPTRSPSRGHASNSPATLGSTAQWSAIFFAAVLGFYGWSTGAGWGPVIAYGCIGAVLGAALGVALYFAWIIFKVAVKIAFYLLGAAMLIAIIASFIH